MVHGSLALSWNAADSPKCLQARQAGVTTVIEPRPKDIGNMYVRRALPSREQRTLGPFVFWDQMGPAAFPPGVGMDVRPHPHIGLGTITYLFEGSIMHRDSLGTVQEIRPGDVNWMRAGRGIVHSERTPDHGRNGSALFGIQSWIALDAAERESVPAFVHVPASELPALRGAGWSARVIAGSFRGLASPVPVTLPILYVDLTLEAGATFELDPEHRERGIHIARGTLEVAANAYSAGSMLVAAEGATLSLTTRTEARVLLLGGAPLQEKLHLWWNFVHTDLARIEQAKADWKAQRFAKVPGDDEFIPLP